MSDKFRQRRVLAGLVMLAGTIGFSGTALAQQSDAPHALHGAGGHSMGAMDPATMDAHFDRHIAEMLPDATAEQKARLKTTAAAFHTQLAALHDGIRNAHRRAHALLLAPKVDRAALEQLRSEEMHALDDALRGLLAKLADAAEVLTPEQRARIAAKMTRPH